jgi:(R,R)-butanediol dehydrogenase/meso-butanediol dehydrogenase/diacetyl reductase
MKAAVFHGPGDIRVEGRPQPVIDRGSVLIAVEQSSLCGTDYHIFRGNFPVDAPLILGHDFSGVVDRVGPDVTAVSIGDRVTAEPIRYCGRCDLCLAGRYTVCEARSIMGMHVDGSLTEYVAAPEQNVFAVPDGVSFEEAALVEAAAVALHSMDYAKPVLGEDVVVLGQGAIGMLHTQVAKAAGVRVIATEVNAARRALSEKFGADCVVDPLEEDPEEGSWSSPAAGRMSSSTRPDLRRASSARPPWPGTRAGSCWWDPRASS